MQFKFQISIRIYEKGEAGEEDGVGQNPSK